MNIVVKGIIIGFSIAAPVGPIGVLCIRRTLAEGRLSGLVTGLGAATADAIYGCVAAFGITLVSSFLLDQQDWIRFIGGSFLCFLGLRTIMAQPRKQSTEFRQGSLIGNYVSTFFLTITNPLTILSFAAIFGGLGLGTEMVDYASATMLVLGVFFGSVSWWFILSGGVSIFRRQVGSQAMTWINRVSGAIIFAFGVVALWGLFAKGG